MAMASFADWQQNLSWNPSNASGEATSGNSGAANNYAAYQNYVNEYQMYAAQGNTGMLQQLNNIHGFTPGVAGGGSAAPAPAAGANTAMIGQMGTMFSQLMSQYGQLLQSFLAQDSEPGASQPDGGMGYEDTVLTRTVLSDEELGKKLATTGAAPQQKVVDPATGKQYASPEAAQSAGVLSWQYVPIEEVS